MVIDTLENELVKLKEEIMKMGYLLEEQIFKAVKSLVDKDQKMAQEVISRDDIIDRMELEIEKKCLQLIAMKQPMAGDLRFIGTALRIIVDMERMADHAEDISEITIRLYEQTYIKPLIDIPRMAKIAEEMVRIALKAFIDADVNLAMRLVDLERQSDELYEQVFRDLLTYMMQDTQNIPQATDLLLVAGHLERIADHATNLGEMVIYTVEGRRVDINVLARDG
ncbi:PhoU [Syntrophomonas zehnderi OL-4]|uniref:Phosphate-specific transport system accessory protein PhoU n=1 Tax=Syntrophomonas zehnderi OL-4 TaxID=690567 RepID=A0A0E3W369_9FIRM|nr:phosphate signaling complex protein PhoU [Syntrophomonas zehnderi]CFX54914.1 PhoU [Syntrophomonas zehnderi OL-4]